jgi:hypothetical protein
MIITSHIGVIGKVLFLGRFTVPVMKNITRLERKRAILQISCWFLV